MKRRRADGVAKEEEDNSGHLLDGETSASSNAVAVFPNDFLESFRFTPAASPSKTRHSLRHAAKGSEKVERESLAQSRLETHQHDSEPTKRKTRKAKMDEDGDQVLPNVPDHVKEDVDILCIGSNPGRMSSLKCQHFGHPSNHFYRTLFHSGLTPQQVAPKDDYTMLHQSPPFFSLGLTNLAARPTRMAHQLSASENAEGALVLLDLIRRNRPRVGVFIGMGVAKAFEQSVRTAQMTKRMQSISIRVPADTPLVEDKELGIGVGLLSIAILHDEAAKAEVKQEGKIESSARLPFTLLFASPSTSGRVTSHQLPGKTECMRRVRRLTEHLTSDDTSREGSDAKLITLYTI